MNDDHLLDEDEGFQPQAQNDVDHIMNASGVSDAFSEQGDNLTADGDMGEEPPQGNAALGDEMLQDLENEIND